MISDRATAAEVLELLAPDLAKKVEVEAPAPKTCLKYDGHPLRDLTTLCVSQADCDDPSRLRCAVAHELEVLLDRITAGPGRPVVYQNQGQWEAAMAEEYRTGARLTSKRKVDLAAVTRLHSAGVPNALEEYRRWLSEREAETPADNGLGRLKKDLYKQRRDALASVAL